MPISEKEFFALPDDKFNQMMAGWAGLCWHTSKKKVVLSCDDDRMPDREGYYCEKCGQWFQENPDFRHSPEGLKIMLEWCKKEYSYKFEVSVCSDLPEQWIVLIQPFLIQTIKINNIDLNPALAIAIGKSKGEIK